MNKILCLIFLVCCGCSPNRDLAVRADGVCFTNVSLIEEYLDWQVAEGKMEYPNDTNNPARWHTYQSTGTTNTLIVSNTIIYYVWLNDEEAEKFKAWRQSKKPK